MAPTVAQFRALSDEELIALHDKVAANTVVGLQWYRDELVRRDSDKQTSTIVRLTWWITVFTLVNVIAAVGVWIRA